MQKNSSATIVVSAASMVFQQVDPLRNAYAQSPVITCAAGTDVAFTDLMARQGFEQQLDFFVSSRAHRAIHCLVPPGPEHDDLDFLGFAEQYASRVRIDFKKVPIVGASIVEHPEALVCHNGNPKHRQEKPFLSDRTAWQLASPAVCSGFTKTEHHQALFRASLRAAIERGVKEVVIINHEGCTPFFERGDDSADGRRRMFDASVKDAQARVQGADRLRFSYDLRRSKANPTPVRSYSEAAA